MEEVLRKLTEKEKESMERQILLAAVELLDEKGFLDSVEKNSLKRRIAYGEA